MTATMGEQLARTIAAKDATALRALLADDVDFRAMTPGKFWEARTPDDVVDVIFGHWFETDDHIDAIERIEVDTVVDRERVGYRFRLTCPDGTYVAEQQAYLEISGGRISWLRTMCSGFRQVSADQPG